MFAAAAGLESLELVQGLDELLVEMRLRAGDALERGRVRYGAGRVGHGNHGICVEAKFVALFRGELDGLAGGCTVVASDGTLDGIGLGDGCAAEAPAEGGGARRERGLEGAMGVEVEEHGVVEGEPVGGLLVPGGDGDGAIEAVGGGVAGATRRGDDVDGGGGVVGHGGMMREVGWERQARGGAVSGLRERAVQPRRAQAAKAALTAQRLARLADRATVDDKVHVERVAEQLGGLGLKHVLGAL